MKPYVLNYSFVLDIKSSQFNYDNKKQFNISTNNRCVVDSILSDSTLQTRELEPTDPDEIVIDSTVTTSTIETSDPNEIIIDSTTNTDSLESVDPDEFVMDSTLITENCEPTDPDELCSLQIMTLPLESDKEDL